MKELKRCLSIKRAAKVYQVCEIQTLQYFTQKIILFSSHQQLLYYQQILTEISTESSQLLKAAPVIQISLNTKKLQMVIISPFINCLSTEGIIKSQKANYLTIDNKMIALLAMNLLDELLKVNRPYFPTCQNIYLYNSEVSLNKISFVGLDLVEFKANISKLDFLQICSILPAKLLNQADYVLVKQFAILVFMLRLIFLGHGNFLQLQEISDFVSVEKAKHLLQVQRQRRRKYFSNSKILQSIELFEKETGMNISRLVIAILIDEEEISWPSFVSQLVEAKVQHTELQANLEFLANYHWNLMNESEKAWLIKIKYVSIKQLQERFDKKDTDFMLMRLTKTRFSHLLSHSCLSNILMNQSNFDMMSYKLWINFIKMLPFDSREAFINFIKESQSKKQGQKVHLTDINGLDSQKYADQSTLQPFSTLQYIVNLPILLDFASKRLRNVVKGQEKLVVFEYSHLKALKEYQSAFR